MAVERMPTTALVPTQEDLIIDDTLSDLDRVVKYGTKSLALQRLVHTRMIGRVSKLEGCVKVVVVMGGFIHLYRACWCWGFCGQHNILNPFLQEVCLIFSILPALPPFPPSLSF